MDNETTMETLREQVATFVSRRITEGFASEDEIVQRAVEYFDEEDPDEVEALAGELTLEALDAHLREQATWTSPTDCDRLDAAFDALTRSGIVARQNFSCCQTCGHGDIYGEVEVESAHRPIDGYVFFHQQDTESLSLSPNLYLAYGALKGSATTDVEIAQRVVDELRASGLTVDWNGSVHSRPVVTNLAWRRRR